MAVFWIYEEVIWMDRRGFVRELDASREELRIIFRVLAGVFRFMFLYYLLRWKGKNIKSSVYIS